MKTLKPIVWAGLLGYLSYKTYTNRRQIAQQLTQTKEALTDGQHSLSELTNQVNSLKEQTPDLQKLSDNLGYKVRVFQQESQPHLEAIQAIMAKYQKKTTEQNKS